MWKKRVEPGYEEFRKKVLKRDKCKCQYPGCKRKGYIVHHIIRYADSVRLRIEVSNGITLCFLCHKYITGKENFYVELFRSIVKDKEC